MTYKNGKCYLKLTNIFSSSNDEQSEDVQTFTILTKDQIFEEQMEQISRISELFEVNIYILYYLIFI